MGCSQWGRTENSMDCIVHRVSKSQTRLSKFHFLFFSFYFAEKVHIIKDMVFPAVVYGCESWTIKKAERGRIDAFEL